MGTTRFKGENASERLDFSGISDSDMIQFRHKPGTEEDTDKGISKANLCSCPFGVSDTSASTAVKSAVLTDSNPDFNLVSGREVVVCFTTANTASSPSLNFAGSGSIPIYYPDGSAVGSWPADTWMHLKYFSVTIGNTSIQRWILLSPLPVDTVALNNMQTVTSNAVSRVMSYSTEEVDTGKTWIDGKTIYRKSGYVSSVSSVPYIVDSVLTDTYVDVLVESKASMRYYASKVVVYGYISATDRFSLNVTSSGLTLVTNFSLSDIINGFYWSVEYTKTN